MLHLFFPTCTIVSLHTSLAQLQNEEASHGMHIIICIMIKFNGPNQVFEFHHI